MDGRSRAGVRPARWGRPSIRWRLELADTFDDMLERSRSAPAPRAELERRLGVLSTRCGFASIAAGNPITEDDEEAKLRLVADTAHAAWG